jgi:hypothetical protein
MGAPFFGGPVRPSGTVLRIAGRSLRGRFLVRARDPGAAATAGEQTIAAAEAAETARMISVYRNVEGPTLDNGRGTQTAGVAPSRLHHL